jgi:hypothetical protein
MLNSHFEKDKVKKTFDIWTKNKCYFRAMSNKLQYKKYAFSIQNFS